MTSVRQASGWVVVLALFLAGGAVAQVSLNGAGALQQYCAAGDAEPHPRLVVMPQVVTTDYLATFGGTLFAAIYQPEAEPAQAGRMTVRLRIKRADGSRERIGKMVAWQLDSGAVEAEGHFPIAVREGDTVIWRYRFTGFESPNAGDCFLLIGATLIP
jgi:hypothetical protein